MDQRIPLKQDYLSIGSVTDKTNVIEIFHISFPSSPAPIKYPNCQNIFKTLQAKCRALGPIQDLHPSDQKISAEHSCNKWFFKVLYGHKMGWNLAHSMWVQSVMASDPAFNYIQQSKLD